MRALWKGSISFGLINIPVALHTATRREELKFRLLRSSDLSPVNYKRVAEVDGREVPWEQVVKGYEYEKGKFIVLKEEDFKRVDVEATQTVDIIDFVQLAEINPIYFQKPYFLEPQKGGTAAYALLRDVLKETGKVGVAKVVIRERQHLASLKPQGSVLMLELMHFSDELVDPAGLKIPAVKAPNKREHDMAKTLVAQMTEKWDPTRYTDDYSSALMKLIEEKIEHGGKSPAAPRVKPKAGSNVIDLVAMLEKSLNQAGKSSAGGKKSRPVVKRKKAA